MDMFPDLKSICHLEVFRNQKPEFIVKGKFSFASCMVCLKVRYMMYALAGLIMKRHKQRHVFSQSKSHPQPAKLCTRAECHKFIESFGVSESSSWMYQLMEIFKQDTAPLSRKLDRRPSTRVLLASARLASAPVSPLKMRLDALGAHFYKTRWWLTPM